METAYSSATGRSGVGAKGSPEGRSQSISLQIPLTDSACSSWSGQVTDT